MNYIDLILLAVLLISLLSGIVKGFIHQLTSLVALTAALVASIGFSQYVARFTARLVDLGAGRNIVAFVLTFLGVLIAIRIFGNGLKKLAQVLMFGTLDKALGGLFSLLKWSFLLSLSLLLFNALNEHVTIVQPKVLAQSKLYRPIKDIVPRVFPESCAWYGAYIKPLTEGR